VEEWSEKTTLVSISCTETTEYNQSIDNKIQNFFISQTFADVTLKVNDREFKAHKLILAATNPVFEAMFKEGTKEHQDNYVNIEDMDSDVFEVFLCYLYNV
jgi:BTB/POZ domain